MIMHRNARKIIMLVLLLCFIPLQGYSWDKEKTEEMIKKAETLLGLLDDDMGLKEFIPYDIYSEAVINIRNSRIHIDNKEYNLAYFYATISTVKLETATYQAKTKKNRFQMVLLERDMIKKNISRPGGDGKSGDGGYRLITMANLFRKDAIYRAEILDRDLFEKTSFTLSGKGKIGVDKIVDVLKKYENASVKIVGHTSFHDYKKISSKKSMAVKNYLLGSGIDDRRIETVSAGNEILMNTAVGFRRIDRVEIIIKGID